MSKKTVYILGAGASYEAKLPIGRDLKGDIARLLNIGNIEGRNTGCQDIRQELVLHSSYNQNAIQNYHSECRHIAENMPLAISIDNFLDSKRDNKDLIFFGKMAIVKAILNAEVKSLFHVDSSIGQQKMKFSLLEDTWYLPFFRTITEQATIDDVAERFKSITLIIFNYDRCIEHFLFHALMSYYRISYKEASQIIGNLTIIHPYGVIGNLEWQESGDVGFPKLEFGGRISPGTLTKCAQGIKTFTEGADSSYMPILKRSMSEAKRLVFLGFAFHPLNMELMGGGDIDPPYEGGYEVECYATALGFSDSDREIIHNSIQHFYKTKMKIIVRDIKCNALFSNYSRSLGYV